MEQETQIYFLRHGQTNNNKEGRMQGRVDIPLNEVGRAQALGSMPCIPAR